MPRPKLNGICKICGEFAENTFEHIPPESAFNDKRILLHSLSYISDESYQLAGKTPKRKHNRGLGEHSLCGRCNHLTGTWYGNAYSSWAQQSMTYLDKVEKNQILYVPFYIQPLNILKQIASFALSMSIAGAEGNPDLARFVLNKRSRYFPADYSCYVYLTNKRSEARYSTESVALDIKTGTMDHVLAEVALPPLGCVVKHRVRERRSAITSDQMCYINHFANYDYNIWATIYLRIPVHRIWSPTPLDYR